MRHGIVWVLAFGICGLLAAARIFWVNYQDEYSDFRPEPLTAVLRDPARAGVADLQEISFPDALGRRVSAWYAPARNGAAVVLAHGTNTDRGALVAEFRALAAAGFGALAFDWPGYGRSEGRVDWGADERSALRAAVDWLSHRAEVDPQRIGAYGYSMGAQMLVPTAAADPRIRAIVLGGVPSSMLEQLRWARRRWGFLSQWPAELRLRRLWASSGERSPLDTIAAIAPRPVLFITSDTDAVVPEWMVRKLYDAAHQPKELWVLHDAEHGHYPEAAGPAYGRRLVDFFSRTLLAGETAAAPR